MATSDVVERLVVSLEARTAAFEKAMNRANAVTTQRTRQIETTWSKTAKFIGNIGKGLFTGAIGLGLGGSIAVVRNFADEIARLGDEAKRSGLSARAFQEFRYVAEQNRVSVEALTDGFKELSLRADEFIVTGVGPAAEAFQRLGLTATELRAKLSDPSALFTEIIGKLQTLDQAAQIRIADELFGGTGGEQFVQLISQGEDGIRRTIEQAHQLGLVLSDETIAAAVELDRKFGAITTTVSTNLKKAIVDATDALAKFIETLPNTPEEELAGMAERIIGIRSEIEQLTIAAGGAFPEIEDDLRSVVVQLLAGETGAEDAKTALLAMAEDRPDFAPIVGDLNGLISVLAMVTGQAQEAKAAIAEANIDPVGTAPTFEGVQATFFPPASPAKPGRGGGGSTAGDRFKQALDSMKERTSTMMREMQLMAELGPACDDYGQVLSILAGETP